MIKSITAILGASFGDESKGKHVAYLASNISENNTCCVIRHSSGAQAGHTVVQDGLKHVFSTYSSGTFAGADTYLSKYFIHNPILFQSERNRANVLARHKMDQISIYAHKDGIITTPFDMIYNQNLENSRGSKRHGSCGVGINATIKRNESISFTLYDARNMSVCDLTEKLQMIQNFYSEYLTMSSLDLDNIREQFITDIFNYLDYLKFVDSNDFLKSYDHLIFEGAQGLLLDQDHKWFPHVTHSKTGSDNIIKIINSLNTNIIPTIYYVTRAYMTRHGAGPFPSECEKPYGTIVDETNKPHAFQETLRFGLFDFELISETINADFKKWNDKANKRIAISCLDQVPDCFKYIIDNFEDVIYKDAFIREVNEYIGQVALLSYGPDTKDVCICQNGERISGQ